MSISLSVISFLGLGGASRLVPPKNGAAVIAAVDPIIRGSAIVGFGFSASSVAARSDVDSMLIGSPVGVLLGGNVINGFLDDGAEDREAGDDGGIGVVGGGGDDALGCGGCSVGCRGGGDGDFPACPSAITAMS